MHFGHDVGHRVEIGVVGVDDHVDAVAQNVEVTVGDQGGDLDQFVLLEIEAGHFAIDPHQFVLHASTLAGDDPRLLFAVVHRPARAVTTVVLGQSNRRKDMFVTDPTQAAQTIAQGYQFASTALELGTVSVDGQVDSTAKVRIPLAMMNRHGLVAGATGTGKTKTLQLIENSCRPMAFRS